jgi:pyruvate/2-oxoglutarate dehydrogenase complex dihydrolipoamide acyltransferase (E2) component
MGNDVPVRLPKLSMAVSEATLVEWLVEDGAPVTEGQPIYAIETEKVETEVEATTSGLLRQRGQAGVSYPVGTEIGMIEQSNHP